MERSIEGYDFQKGEVLLFAKEIDWTSFDLVRKLRNYLCRQTGIKKLKVGHAGTLDPKATGLMIICTGKETKNIDLLQAKEKELYEAKMQFFTNVAHEIKTPLTLIKGPLENVIKKAGEMPEIKNSLRIMEKNTERLVDLTNQLLDFRQTEINGFSLNFTKENIIEIAEDIFTSFKPLADKKGIELRITLPQQELLAFIDVDAFNKILTNLLSNAIKYAST